MAYWQKKPNGSVAVYYRDASTRKLKALPRKQISHLDNMTDEEIELWVGRWSNLHEVRKKRPDLQDTPIPLQMLFDEFLAHLRQQGKRVTTENHHKWLLKLVGSYFQDTPLTAWPDISKHFYGHLRGKGVSTRTIKRAQQTLRLFWRYMYDTGRCDGELRMPRTGSPRQAGTPLQRLISPEEVIAFVISTGDERIRFMALVGYFFSLRPQEVIAVTMDNFVAGDEATRLECCKVMGRAGLFSRLAVYIKEQRAIDGMVEPKTKDKGYVACFNERAAALIVDLLNSGFEGIKLKPSPAAKYWRDNGMKGVTLKDLRRASLYWLGHNTSLGEIPLMNHARHADFNTTRLYLRRPDERAPAPKKRLDL